MRNTKEYKQKSIYKINSEWVQNETIFSQNRFIRVVKNCNNYSQLGCYLNNILFPEQCPPGTYARKIKFSPRKHPNLLLERISLSPYCRSCTVGTYQSEFGKLSCIPCPRGHTTTTVRSTDIGQCIPTVQQICSGYSNPCKAGKCVIINDFYYSCECYDDFVGKYIRRCTTKLKQSA